MPSSQNGDGRNGTERLAEALAAGDVELAFEILMASYGERIYGYCRRMLGSDTDADDVSQIVFLQAFHGVERLAGVESACAWLLGIARHRCLDQLKARRRRRKFLNGPDLRVLYDAAEGTIEPRDPRVGRALDDCMDGLDERSRAVVMLRFHDDLSYDEIGRLLSETPGALRVRVSRALPELRDCLEGKGVDL